MVPNSYSDNQAPSIYEFPRVSMGLQWEKNKKNHIILKHETHSWYI